MKNIYEQKKADGETVFRVDKSYKGERYVQTHPSAKLAEADLTRVMDNWNKGLMANGSPRLPPGSAEGPSSGSVKHLLDAVRRLMSDHGATTLTITETEHRFGYS